MDLRRNSLPRLLAGLQVGILGGLLIFLWFLLLSYWGFRSPWGLLNLIAASLRNHATWGLALSASTWTGLAAHIFACGCLGMAVGWILPRPVPQVRISLSGFVFGIVLSLMVYELVWNRYVPLLGEYIRPVAALISHLLFGLSLAQFPKFYHPLIDDGVVHPEVLLLPAPENTLDVPVPESPVPESPVPESPVPDTSDSDTLPAESPAEPPPAPEPAESSKPASSSSEANPAP
ncbi:MAG: hypothetical protein JNL98_01580 [Bryobacterales bacterium]|nr:hypothetical protein [Bryobacterales bacterium]